MNPTPNLAGSPDEPAAAMPADARAWAANDVLPPPDSLPPDMNSQRADPLQNDGGKRIPGEQYTYRQQDTSRYTLRQMDQPPPTPVSQLREPPPEEVAAAVTEVPSSGPEVPRDAVASDA